ncbi:MAG TPA: ice-binding family protein, partial [Egibacteraceae bacterium]|nr:ice-binding family protein [Egibacteraceae bacterium]
MARAVTVISLVLVLVTAGSVSQAASHPVDLGTADSFAVLAGSTITNIGTTTIIGDIGLHPGTDVTGYDTVIHTGELYVDDPVAEQAQADLTTAYNDAAGREPTATLETELGGEVLGPGVYTSASGTFEITGTLTLEGGPDDVFIFQMASTLVTAPFSEVVLIGVNPCNVFWQVGSSATLGTGSSFAGTIMALESITLNTGATVDGRTLARNGAVTMNSNTISQTCVPPTTTTTTTTVPTTTTTTVPTTTTTTVPTT